MENTLYFQTLPVAALLALAFALTAVGLSAVPAARRRVKLLRRRWAKAKNAPRYISKEAAAKIKDKARAKGVTVIEWDGKAMTTREKMFYITSVLFTFPEEWHESWDAWYGWMCAKYYFPDDAYALFVNDFDDFLAGEPDGNQTAARLFEGLRLWWRKDVTRCVVGGKAKRFNVYCVTDNRPIFKQTKGVTNK